MRRRKTIILNGSVASGHSQSQSPVRLQCPASSASNPKVEEGAGRTQLLTVGLSNPLGPGDAPQLSWQSVSRQAGEQRPPSRPCTPRGWSCLLHTRASAIPAALPGSIVPPSPRSGDARGYFIPLTPSLVQAFDTKEAR